MEIDNPDLEPFRREWREELGLNREGQQASDHKINGESPFYGDIETPSASTSVATETLRGESTIRGSSVDVEMIDARTPLCEPTDNKRFIVAIDFGTTFSSVSFLALPRDTGTNDELNSHMYVDEIQSIVNYPNEPRYGFLPRRKEVPTEIWYPKKAYLDQTLLRARHQPSDIIIVDDLDNDQAQNRDQDPDEDADIETDEDADDEENKDTFWGYEVHQQLRYPDTNRNQNRRMARFKLLLDEGERTEKIRMDLEPNLKELKRKKIIKDKEDVIADYLKYLFSHARDELMKRADFSDACPVEFVLCVPPIWTPKASRIMQKNMERAICESGFGSVQNNSVDNLFIVSEPEAAAAYMLASTTTVSRNETFVLIDAGGGTVDAITYTVDKTYPLRLKAEGVEAGGDLCGSSYLNEAFQAHLHSRLQGEDYLEVNGLTIESIIDVRLFDFENEMKRSMDIVTFNNLPDVIFVQGLRANPNPEKRFTKNRVKISRTDLKEIFDPFLERVAVLMRAQLQGAKENGLNVKKVILIGGFADSPSLQSYLTRELAVMRNYKEDRINLILPRAAETAVSSGAVLRALNKKDGPKRISRSSYGFLCTEVHEPDEIPAHRGIRPFSEPLDGRKYVKYTIFWLINKGDEIPTQREYPIRVFYIFDAEDDARFECKEFLFVSDNKMESHYRKNHEKNKGATVVGVIETDMTFLKERNLIQPVEPEEGVRARRHYKVEYELVMIVNDRNLRWEARYPAGGEVQGVGQISIAAAFVPGTK
ncbi:hypothetical protein V502_10543 [Pseudogymnoascus sp. VKM F-4520 (FW-2644)]|nr:hypothetical protein V502_10543 [Pseudogymnoascus sp. VKM F-4520 (FW-2644)]